MGKSLGEEEVAEGMGPHQGDLAVRGEGLGFDFGLKRAIGGFAQGSEEACI